MIASGISIRIRENGGDCLNTIVPKEPFDDNNNNGQIVLCITQLIQNVEKLIPYDYLR